MGFEVRENKRMYHPGWRSNEMAKVKKVCTKVGTMVHYSGINCKGIKSITKGTKNGVLGSPLAVIFVCGQGLYNGSSMYSLGF